jgi:hypothetical protein
MKKFEQLKICRVCGFDNGFLVWGNDGKTPSYEICPCCGCEFGFDDDGHASTDPKHYRKEWIDSGTKWNVSRNKPKNWNFKEQMKNIPKKYL